MLKKNLFLLTLLHCESHSSLPPLINNYCFALPMYCSALPLHCSALLLHCCALPRAALTVPLLICLSRMINCLCRCLSRTISLFWGKNQPSLQLFFRFASRWFFFQSWPFCAIRQKYFAETLTKLRCQALPLTQTYFAKKSPKNGPKSLCVFFAKKER